MSATASTGTTIAGTALSKDILQSIFAFLTLGELHAAVAVARRWKYTIDTIRPCQYHLALPYYQDETLQTLEFGSNGDDDIDDQALSDEAQLHANSFILPSSSSLARHVTSLQSNPSGDNAVLMNQISAFPNLIALHHPLVIYPSLPPEDDVSSAVSADSFSLTPLTFPVRLQSLTLTVYSGFAHFLLKNALPPLVNLKKLHLEFVDGAKGVEYDSFFEPMGEIPLDFTCLRDMPQLEDLSLHIEGIMNDTFNYQDAIAITKQNLYGLLKHLTALRRLHLGSSVSVENVEDLDRLTTSPDADDQPSILVTNLTSLSLQHLSLSESVMTSLLQFKSLTELCPMDCVPEFTNLDPLTQAYSNQLHSLSLTFYEESPVTADSLIHILNQFTSLTRLRLSHPTITSEHLCKLFHTLTSIRDLSIDECSSLSSLRFLLSPSLVKQLSSFSLLFCDNIDAEEVQHVYQLEELSSLSITRSLSKVLSIDAIEEMHPLSPSTRLKQLKDFYYHNILGNGSFIKCDHSPSAPRSTTWRVARALYQKQLDPMEGIVEEAF